MAAWALLLSAVLGGASATYAIDEEAGIGWRLAAGTAIGLAVLGLAGFVSACLLGLTPGAVVLAGLVALSPVLFLARRRTRARFIESIGASRASATGGAPDARVVLRLVMALFALLLVWRIYDRAMFVTPDGIFTGVDHNLGDLPFHLGVISSFTEGANLPPEHPELAGAPLTYPFLCDLVSAMLIRAGARLRDALFVPNLALGVALIALLYSWGGRFAGSAGAALLTPALVLLDGGWGFWHFFRDAAASGDLPGLLRQLGRDYTISPAGDLRWGNAVTTLLVPQRSFLFGLPLVLVVWSLWWRAVVERSPEPTASRRAALMGGAGVVTGLLPLVHAHSFASLLAMAACLALLFRPLRAWLTYFVAAALLATPQVVWMMRGSALQGRSFLAWEPGWDHGSQPVLWFWLVNTGLFLPLVAMGVAIEGRRRKVDPAAAARLRFWLPSVLWFIVPNLLRLSPWVWDNVKFLLIFWVASAPLVALALVRLYRTGWPGRAAAAMVLLSLVLAGGLDVWRVASGAIELPLFDPDGMAFAAAVAETTPPRALVLHAPTYDSPLLLSGRRSLLGYPGHIWSQGLDAGTREADLHAIYQGRPEAESLLQRYGVDYVALGPQERALGVRDEWWAGYPPVAQAGPYRLLRVGGGGASAR